MSNFGNSNPKVIAAAFAAAAVIGVGAFFVMNGAFSSILPGTSVKQEATPSAPSGNTQKKEETPAGSVEAIVKLAENHDASAFKARVDMKMAESAGVDAIAALYEGGDVTLIEIVHEAFEGAIAGAIPENRRSIAINLGLIGVDFVGIGEVKETGNQATVVINLGGESLPNGFPLQLGMEKREGKWNITSISNSRDFVKVLQTGRNAVALQYVEQEKPFIKKYNESIKALKAKHPVLSAEYANGYEAAEKELMAGYASLKPPICVEKLVQFRQKRHNEAMEHIRLIRAYVAGDHSDANQQQRKEVEQRIDKNSASIRSIIQQFKK